MISSFSDSPRVVTEITAPIETVLLLSAGLYLNVKSVPLLKYFSSFFYANEAMSIDYWLMVDEIGKNQSITQFDHNIHNDPIPSIVPDCYTNLPCLHNGTEVLESLNFGTTYEQIYYDYVGLTCLIIVFHLIAFFGTRRLIRKTGFY
jgi:ATP-binding cassette, subfamily G (WHITE), eye pigment precursor transporter